MDQATLVRMALGFDVDGGRRLLERLRHARFPFVAALWYYFSEPEVWRLVIASPEVDSTGPYRAYETVQQQLMSLSETGLTLSDVSVVSPTRPLIAALRAGLPLTGSDGKQLHHTFVGGMYIDDAYVYYVELA